MTTAIVRRLRWLLRRPVTSLSHLRAFSSSSSSSCVSVEGREGDLTETLPPFIHQTAIVHPNALIEQGDDLPGCTLLGDDNVIGHHALVGVKCQDLKYKPGEECYLDIGDSNEIREFTTIHRSSKPDDRTVIGDHNFIMGSCHIAHDCKVGHHNIFANNTLLGGHVVVQDHVNTGGCTNVHQFCHICSYSFIGGGSVVSRDVPRYMMVAGERAEVRGLNLEGLKRRGFTSSEVRKLREAYRKLFAYSGVVDGVMEDRILQLERDEKLGEVPVVISMLKSIRDSIHGVNRRGICAVRSRRKTH